VWQQQAGRTMNNSVLQIVVIRCWEKDRRRGDKLYE
jgi:hypothetical protein